MRTLLAALAACVLLCAQVSAAPIDSSASGMYLGATRVCSVVLQRYQVRWVQVQILCIRFDGQQSSSMTTVWSPNACPQGGAYSLTPWAQVEYLSLRSFDPVQQTLAVVIGTSQQVHGGIGTAETWYRLASLASAGPYSCNARKRD